VGENTRRASAMAPADSKALTRSPVRFRGSNSNKETVRINTANPHQCCRSA
jgi:hypothetical protein